MSKAEKNRLDKKQTFMSVAMIAIGLIIGVFSILYLGTVNERKDAATLGIADYLKEYEIVKHDRGEEISFKTQKMKFNSVLTKKTIDLPDGRIAKAGEGNMYLVVNQTVTNTTDEPTTYVPYMLFDRNDYRYRTIGAEDLTYGNYLFGRTLQPGQAESGTITFKVPESIKNYKFGALKTGTNEMHVVEFSVD